LKIAVVGDWHSQVHEAAVFDAFKHLGHDVSAFKWHAYFQATNGAAGRLWRRLQNKFLIGPIITRINRDLLRHILESRPELLFVYRGTHITAATLQAIRRAVPSCILVSYNNDDPFAPGHPDWLWRHFLAAIPHYDLVLAYRHHNLDDFRRAGARQVELLRSWFIPERNHPVALSTEDKTRYGCDVVFVGHYEPDQRLACMEAIAQRGWQFRLFGPGYDWDPIIRRSPALRSQIPVCLVWGEDYNRALCGARIALCFLSKLNRDTYTRRCFEIPATGTMMLAEYTDDLASMFKEGEEVEFFRTQEEMMIKIDHYLNRDTKRLAVAEAGRKRVHADGHDVVFRMRQVLAWVSELRELSK